MSAPKKSNKPAKPDNAAADLGATGFVVDQIRQALGCSPDEDVLDKARAAANELALVKAALHKSEDDRDAAFRAVVNVLKNHGLPVGDAIDPDKIAELAELALAGLNQRLDQACEILGIPEDKRNVDAMLTALREQQANSNRRIEEIRVALRGGDHRDKSLAALAEYRMHNLDSALEAHHAYEAEHAQTFRALTLLLGKAGVTVAGDKKLSDLPTLLDQSLTGLDRQLAALRREVLDAKRVLGIDDPAGMLLDEQGHVMGDIMDAWAETKRVLLVNQYPIPDSLPAACRALVELVKELDGRIDSALGNLARHTSATAIEDATMEVRDKLDDAETRLKHLENERLRQALEDPEFPPRGPIAMGTLNITSIDGGDENARIVRDLMRKIVDGKISLLHNV